MNVSRLFASARRQCALRPSTCKTLGSLFTLWAVGAGTAHAQPTVVQTPRAEAPATTAATAVPLPAPATAAAGAQPAQPQGPAEGSSATIQDAVRAALSHWGCLPADLLEHEARWYAACAAAGVLVVERRDDNVLVLGERRPVPGQAHALFVRGGTVWVESTRIEAHPIGQLAVSAAPSAEASASARPKSLLPTAPRAAPSSDRAGGYSKLAPPRIGRQLSVKGGLRPYLPMRALGVAALADVAVSYRGERAWYVQAQLHPLGGTVTRGQDATVFGGNVGGGYDHPYFAVGLGLGTLRRAELHSAFDPVQRRTRDWTEHRFGLSLTQALRLGALDGLNLALTTAFVLDDERWRFGYFDLTLQVPLNRQTWLTAAGGGADQAGYLYAEVGLRRLIRGDLGSGSLFVEPSVGVAGIDNRIDGVGPGPMIGCHLEWRK